MKLMNPEDIPAFVQEVAATGCNITAVASGYTIGDADLSEEDYETAPPELQRILEAYGSRHHLLGEINTYLTSIGRCYPPPQVH